MRYLRVLAGVCCVLHIVWAEEQCFRDLWEERFFRRPIVGMQDERALADTYLFAGSAHWSSQLCVLLAGQMRAVFDDEWVFRSYVPLPLLWQRAEELKGERLTEGERQAVRRLWLPRERWFSLFHHQGLGLPLAAFAVNLKSTVGRTQDVGLALRRIAHDRGCVVDYGMSESPTEEQLLQLLHEGHPVILERCRKGWLLPWHGDDGKWLMVFGAYRDEGGCWRFLVNVPEETTLLRSFIWQNTQDALESIGRGTISEFIRRRSVRDQNVDQRSLIDCELGNRGLSAVPFGKLAGLRLHALRDWRRSGASWDDELQGALGLRRVLPAVGGGESAGLWRRTFGGRRGEAGLGFRGGTLRRFCLAETGEGGLADALVSVVGMVRPDFVAFGLGHPGRLFHAARMALGHPLMLPGKAEVQACVSLQREELASYVSRYGEVPPTTPCWDDDGYARYVLERRQPGWRSPHSQEAHLLHSLPAILAGARDVRGAVGRLPAACGWSARVEGGPGTGWETLRLAVWRGVPVILEGRGGEWRVAVAYLEEKGKRLLLVMSCGGRGERPRVSLYDLPDELPEGLEFIEYDESRWTPWLVHHVAPTVEHLAPQVREIFRRHLEESPQKAQNRIKDESTKDAK